VAFARVGLRGGAVICSASQSASLTCSSMRTSPALHGPSVSRATFVGTSDCASATPSLILAVKLYIALAASTGTSIKPLAELRFT
jgi:hypothetical protein